MTTHNIGYVRYGRGGPSRGPNEALILAAIERGERGAEIGVRLGISRERVRQIYTRATGLGLPDYGTLCRTCGLRYLGSRVAHRQEPPHREAMIACRERQRASVIERFWSRVDRSGPASDFAPWLGDCWIWIGKSVEVAPGHRYGHASFQLPELNQRTGYAHRAAYVLTFGRLPVGSEIDHLCRVTLCCRPTHLQAVSHRENILRSPIAQAAINARKTHCPAGHPYDLVNGKGHRGCRNCRNARMRQRYAEKRAAA